MYGNNVPSLSSSLSSPMLMCVACIFLLNMSNYDNCIRNSYSWLGCEEIGVQRSIFGGKFKFTAGGLKMRRNFSLSLLWKSAVGLLFVLQGTVETAGKTSISVSKTLVFGPGVGKDTTSLPLNYFFIQARDSSGDK